MISLQNAMNSFHWLAIREGKFIGDVSIILMFTHTSCGVVALG